MELPDLIASEQYHQHTRAATVARLLVWLYGWAAVMMACGIATERVLR